MPPILEVDALTIGFGNAEPVVRDVSFSVNAGETLALVGESGVRQNADLSQRAQDPARSRADAQRADQFCRKRRCSEPAGCHGTTVAPGSGQPDLDDFSRTDAVAFAFAPARQSGGRVLHIHRGLSLSAAKREVLEQFEKVGFVDPERAWRSYPFEMSGGMRQRAMIAMAMVAKPEVLIADEPTTALDVTTQAQVLGLIRKLQQDTGMAVILVTHDLGVVANMAQQVVVMNKGRVMEAGRAADVLGAPAHKYTAKLLPLRR